MLQVGNKELLECWVGNKQVLQIWDGPNLVWSKDSPPPVGRVIPIPLSNMGDIVVNGNSLPYEGGTTTLQDGDIIELQGPQFIRSIWFTNFNLSSGKATVRTTGLIEVDAGFTVTGVTKNIDFDFVNSGNKDLVVYWHDEASGALARIWFDNTNQGNWENVSFSGLDTQLYDEGVGSAIFQFGTDTPLSYNNGAGTLCSNGLRISNCRFWVDPEETPYEIYKPIIIFPGELDDDTGHHKNLTIDNIILEGGEKRIESLVVAHNIENLVLHDFTLSEYNNEIAPGTYHARLMKIGGTGKIYNIKSTNYYGNVAQIYPLKRVGTNNDWKIWNIIGYDSPMYSIFEAQIFPESLVAGFFESCPLLIAHATAKQLGYSEEFRSDILDQFNYTGAVVVNSVIDSCFEPGIGAGSNNYIYPETPGSTDPLIDTTTFEPAPGSVIIGMGGSTPEWAMIDINGNERAATGATLGAVEPV